MQACRAVEIQKSYHKKKAGSDKRKGSSRRAFSKWGVSPNVGSVFAQKKLESPIEGGDPSQKQKTLKREKASGCRRPKKKEGRKEGRSPKGSRRKALMGMAESHG